MSRPQIRFYDDRPRLADMRSEIIEGLRSNPKSIPPKYFYDERGSRLFDEICRSEEYYATRTEIELLRKHVAEISEVAGPDCLLVELGSGSSIKVRLLLDSLRPSAYMPIDISRDYLFNTANQLAEDCPWLDVHATCMDYTQQLDLPYDPGLRRVIFFPGSSIGNFEPAGAKRLLTMIADKMNPGDALVVGVDLKKDKAVLDAAYNDAGGITAAFNKNVLEHINNKLGANFNLDNFTHVAFYNEQSGRVEMHLESLHDQIVMVAGQPAYIKRGERIHTENSYKYSVEEFVAMGGEAGMTHLKTWTDPRRLFSIHCFTRA